MAELKISSLEEFAEEVKAEIEKRYGLPVMLQERTKNNGVKRLSLVIREHDINVSPAIYLEPYYEMYEQEGFEHVVNIIWECYEYNKVRENFDISVVSNYEKAKGKLAAGVINYKMNEKLLQSVPHEQFLDLAIVAYVELGQPIVEEGSATVLVSENLREIWGITPEEVIQQALYNVRDDAVIKDIVDALHELGAEHLLALLCNKDKGFLYVISNKKQYHGGIHIMNKAAISKFADEKNVKYVYIMPSSVHEVMLLPVTNTVDIDAAHRLRKIVSEVNESQLPVEQILSNNVYLYSREENDLKIV